MDTTPKYIEMCDKAQKAVNLNDYWELDSGSFCWCKLTPDEPPKVISHTTIICNPHTDKVCIAVKVDNVDDCINEFDFKSCFAKVDFKKYPMEYWVWLPRQDQLQEMLKDKYVKWEGDMCIDFVNFVWAKNGKNIKIFKSYEQLWLGLVMFKLFDKIWNDEDWKERR